MLLSPKAMLVWGLVLLLLGWILPILMVMKFLPSTFLLNFLAYAASTAGLLLGMSGLAMYQRAHRRKNEDSSRKF